MFEEQLCVQKVKAEREEYEIARSDKDDCTTTTCPASVLVFILLASSSSSASAIFDNKLILSFFNLC